MLVVTSCKNENEGINPGPPTGKTDDLIADAESLCGLQDRHLVHVWVVFGEVFFISHAHHPHAAATLRKHGDPATRSLTLRKRERGDGGGKCGVPGSFKGALFLHAFFHNRYVRIYAHSPHVIYLVLKELLTFKCKFCRLQFACIHSARNRLVQI